MYISAFSAVDMMGIRKKYEQKDNRIVSILVEFLSYVFNDVSHCFQNC